MQKKTKVVAGAVGGLIAAAGALLLLRSPTPAPLPPTLPMYAYEGEVILGYDVPPRMYALVETDNRWWNIKLTTPECKPAAWNFPCHVLVHDKVRLHINHCVDARDIDRVVFDYEGCQHQRAYNQNFPVLRVDTGVKAP